MTKTADLYHHKATLERNLSRRLDKFGGDKEIVDEFIHHNIALGKSPARIIKYFDTLIPLKRLLKKDFKDSTEELKDFARMTGNDDIHKLGVNDLCTANSEISNHADINHV